MRFHLGAIPESADFRPDETWTALSEPSPWAMQIIALPIGIVTLVLFVFLWMRLGAGSQEPPISDNAVWILPIVIGIIVVHEILHALVHPGFGLTRRSLIGVWPAKLLCYAHFEDEMSRNRLLLVFLMPLLMISCVPLFFAAIQLHFFKGTPSIVWMFISCFNALAACGDLVGVALIWYQVPGSGIVRNQGWRSYWRLPACDPPTNHPRYTEEEENESSRRSS